MHAHRTQFPAALVLLLLLAACGTGQPLYSGPTSLTGQVVAPDGSTPLAGATVYLPGAGSSSLSLQQTGNCDLPSESYSAYACTDSSGQFALDAEASAGEVTLKVFKGSFNFSVVVKVRSATTNVGAITTPSDPAQGGARIAVVTGLYDEIENLLAKLGFGEVDEYGVLKLGSETFDLYDGGTGLPDGHADFAALFADADGDSSADIHGYDIVFVNCGADEALLWESDGVTPNAATRNELRTFVEQGGTLYATDLAYDYVEQVFPEFIDFYRSDTTADSEPEEPFAAERGVSDIEVDAEILDSTLASWLANVTCGGSSCLQPNGTVHVAGFLSGWAVMDGAHTGTNVKLWAEGDVSTLDETNVRKPLTASFDLGAGQVIFSSYHTEHTFSTEVSPQERILQFLVFE
jgi:hypothetical protein